MLPLSVIICTYNRVNYLQSALGSLLVQTLPQDQFEVIVIDDGSADGTRELVGTFASQLPVRYYYQENSGLAAAKNHGIERAEGEIIFFFDDDDTASPALLEEHLRTHKKFPKEDYAVLNYTTWAPQLKVTSFMKFITEVGCYLFAYPGISNGAVLDYTYFWGGRSSCKRSLLNGYGKFNPVFRFGCEDIELGYRLSKHGLKVVYNANAVSYMQRSLKLEDFLKRLEKQGASQYRFSIMYNDKEVQKWSEVENFEEEWRKIMGHYDVAVNSAAWLEKISNIKLESGLEIDAMTERLFYQSLGNIQGCQGEGDA